MTEHFIGKLYGCDLVLKTDDAKCAGYAARHMDYLVARDQELSRREMHEELASMIPKRMGLLERVLAAWAH